MECRRMQGDAGAANPQAKAAHCDDGKASSILTIGDRRPYWMMAGEGGILHRPERTDDTDASRRFMRCRYEATPLWADNGRDDDQSDAFGPDARSPAAIDPRVGRRTQPS